MKFRLCLVALLILPVAFKANSQDRKRSFGLAVGPAFIQRQDLIFSPFIHSDFTLKNIQVNYSSGSKTYHCLQFAFTAHRLSEFSSYRYIEKEKEQNTYPHHITLIRFDYMAGLDLVQRANSFLKVGGLFAGDIQALNYVYGPISHFGYFSTFGLGAFLRYEYNKDNRNRFAGVLKLPVLLWVSRSPYLVNDDEFIENISSHSSTRTFAAFLQDGALEALSKIQNIEVEANYVRILNAKWSLGISYVLGVTLSEDPRSLSSYRNAICFSGTFYF